MIIWFSSSIPDPEKELLGDSPLRIVLSAIPLRDKLKHAVIYFFMGILVCMAMNHTRYPSKLSRLRENAAFSFLFGVIYGAMDEIHQHFVPPRSMDVLDLFADMIGVLCGVYLVYTLTKEYEELMPRKPEPG